MLKCSVKSVQFITPTSALLTLLPNKRSHFHFEPGQYAAISFIKGRRPSHVRCFSIVSSPLNSQELQFAMRVEGNFTQSASKLTPGDTIYVQGPFGDFVIDSQFDRNIVLIAGGIGITPFISILRYAAQVKLSIPITLLYSCRSADDIPFYDELVSLQKSNPRFRVVFFVGGQVAKLSGVTAFEGRITKERLDRLTNGKWNSFTYFLCGPPSFMDSLHQILRGSGTEEQRILTEEFTQSKKTELLESSPKKIVYALSSLLVILSVVGVMGVDLAHAVPKILAKESGNAGTSSVTSNSTSVQTQTVVTPTTNSSNVNGSTETSNNAYQSPVTAVS